MENLSLVAAIGKSNELGLDNHLIWKIKEDLAFYRNLTLYQNIIMGRKTFESMSPKALEKRTPFVLSRTPLDKYSDVNSFSSIDSLLQYIEITNQNFIVVGGAQIYEAFLPYVETMYLTEINENAEADTFFPDFDLEEWDIETIAYHNVDHSIVPYVRNRYVRRRIK